MSDIRIIQSMFAVDFPGENKKEIMNGASSEIMPEFDNFEPGDNPFRYDHFHMGKDLGSNITIMFANHDKEKMTYIIFINKNTGERFKITFSDWSY